MEQEILGRCQALARALRRELDELMKRRAA